MMEGKEIPAGRARRVDSEGGRSELTPSPNRKARGRPPVSVQRSAFPPASVTFRCHLLFEPFPQSACKTSERAPPKCP